MPALLSESNRKRPANLSLAPDRLRFGQAYAEANHTSLSKVVEELLGALEQALTAHGDQPSPDPLDGLLVDWPQGDKKDIRREQHGTRLVR